MWAKFDSVMRCQQANDPDWYETTSHRVICQLNAEHPMVLNDVDKAIQSLPSNDPEKPGQVESLRRLCNTIESSSLSTCFSGIETPGTSMLMLGQAISQQLGEPLNNAPHMRHTYAVEWNSRARDEILNHPNCPEHVFGNVEDFWSPNIAAKIKALVHNNLVDSVLIPLICQTQCTTPRAYCYKHNAYCKADDGWSSQMHTFPLHTRGCTW